MKLLRLRLPSLDQRQKFYARLPGTIVSSTLGATTFAVIGAGAVATHNIAAQKPIPLKDFLPFPAALGAGMMAYGVNKTSIVKSENERLKFDRVVPETMSLFVKYGNYLTTSPPSPSEVVKGLTYTVVGAGGTILISSALYYPGEFVRTSLFPEYTAHELRQDFREAGSLMAGAIGTSGLMATFLKRGRIDGIVKQDTI